MALKPAHFALAVAFFGVLAFALGVIAENKKPAAGTKIEGKGVIICKFPSDPTIVLGSLAAVSLLISGFLGVVAVFFPYKGQSVPKAALFRSIELTAFFAIAVSATVLAEAFMLWATITEGLHRKLNIHHNLSAECATATTGLFGGAGFLALDAAVFWLICQILTHNARSDYLQDEDPRGTYRRVLATNNYSVSSWEI